MAGKRVDLSNLADEEDETPRRNVRAATAMPTPRVARLDQVATNPLNTRDVHLRPDKITEIAESMRVHGQLQPCAVVTRRAFLGIYPEHEEAIGPAVYVQVTGARRRAAAFQAGLPNLEIVVKDELAASRAALVSATAAENIDREDLDLIEEARAVELLVQEAGSGKLAAEQLSRTPGWVSQRRNLLKLTGEVQAALRAGEVPLRQVREWHTLPTVEQRAALEEWRRRRRAAGLDDEKPADDENPASEPVTAAKQPAAPRSMTAVAIRRLGGTPDKIAASLRTELSREDLQALIQELLAQIGADTTDPRPGNTG